MIIKMSYATDAEHKQWLVKKFVVDMQSQFQNR